MDNKKSVSRLKALAMFALLSSYSVLFYVENNSVAYSLIVSLSFFTITLIVKPDYLSYKFFVVYISNVASVTIVTIAIKDYLTFDGVFLFFVLLSMLCFERYSTK